MAESVRNEEGSQPEDPKEQPKVRKFTPEGVDVPLNAEEQQAALRAYQNVQGRNLKEEYRRAAFGEYNEVVSFLRDNLRFIAVGPSVYWVPEHQIPLQFFISFALSCLGKEWRKDELAKTPTARHPIAQWALATDEHVARARPDRDGVVRLMPNAGLVALGRLGYEAFIVQNNAAFRDEVWNRLRQPREFFGALNELSVGAFLTIAGFSVRYLEERAYHDTPDMHAIHADTDIQFHVEAKRKHRDRSANPSPRTLDGGWDLKLRRTLHKATKQLADYARPWMICVDLDLPCPIPEPPDSRFMDAVCRELKATGRKATPPVEEPELVLLLQMPHHRGQNFDLRNRMQVQPVASPAFGRSAKWNALAPVLQRAREAFPRMPFTWGELGQAEDEKSE